MERGLLRNYKKRVISLLLIIPVITVMLFLQTHIRTLAASELEFSFAAGFYESPIDLVLNSDVPNAKIYYTLNCTAPDPLKVGSGTFLYQAPIHIVDRSPELNQFANIKAFGNGTPIAANIPIPKCTIVKAIAVSEAVQTKVYTNTYFIDPLKETKYNLPVFSLSTDPANLYDETKGLFVNQALQNSTDLAVYEKPLHLEFFDENGVQVLNQDTGVQLHGASTKFVQQKTLRIYARTEYDPINNKLDYPFFPGLKDSESNPITSFKRILLRNSGNDFGDTMLRDAFNQILVGNLNFEEMAYRPAVAYVCGEFYGIVNIRERFDNEYVASHFPVKKSDVVMIGCPNANGGLELAEGVQGDQAHYVNLNTFINQKDLNIKANLDYVNTQIDLSSFKDYFAMEMFIVNTDWPGINSKIWRSKQAVPLPGVK